MNLDDHYRNRNALPEEELKKYYGKHVAWSLDGTRIVASGEDDFEVFKAIEAAGYTSDQVVLSYIPFPDEIILGRWSLLGLEEDECDFPTE
ncbi:MAG TPA: DUF5678 domain-containing protein [Gemmataceae bacterium]|jgi:hypothetical protein|nr:DUF5678 domain-containing protein [Gemmataceae bacterium]